MGRSLDWPASFTFLRMTLWFTIHLPSPFSLVGGSFQYFSLQLTSFSKWLSNTVRKSLFHAVQTSRGDHWIDLPLSLFWECRIVCNFEWVELIWSIWNSCKMENPFWLTLYLSFLSSWYFLRNSNSGLRENFTMGCYQMLYERNPQRQWKLVSYRESTNKIACTLNAASQLCHGVYCTQCCLVEIMIERRVQNRKRERFLLWRTCKTEKGIQ